VETVDKQLTIGGSEVYELLNEPTYGKGCRRALAYKKLDYKPDFDLGASVRPLLDRGLRLEQVAADMAAEQRGWKLIRNKTKTHKQFPWARVSTDRLIRRQNGIPVGDLEIKTRSEGAFYRILRDGPLKADQMQLQWSLWITGHSWGSLAELGVFSDLPLKTFDYPADKEMFEIYENEGRAFNEQVFVNKQLPPPPFEASDPRCKVCPYRLTCRGEEVDPHEWNVQKQIAKTGKNLVQLDDPEMVEAMTDIALFKAEIDSLEESSSLAKEKVLAKLVGYDGAVLRGYGNVYRTAVIQHRFDTKRFKEDKPDIYEQYLRTIHTGNYSLRGVPFKNKETEKHGND
jgi:hypothetical protein